MAAGSYAYLGEAEVVGAGAALLGETAGPPPCRRPAGQSGRRLRCHHAAGASAAAAAAAALLGQAVVAAAALECEAAAAAGAAAGGGRRRQLRPHLLGDRMIRIHRASLDGLLVAACGRCGPLISKIAFLLVIEVI
jgi:hypothetical protein